MEEIPKFNNRENEHIILPDNREIWLSRSPAINAVVLLRHNHNLYLLTGERGEGTPDFQGYWNIPCGYLDWDENGTQACYREVWEETGLNLQKLMTENIIFKNDMTEPWGVKTNPSSNKQNISLRYGVYLSAKELPTLSNEYCEEGEVGELEWLRLDKIDDLDKRDWAFGHKQLIIDYLNRLNLL